MLKNRIIPFLLFDKHGDCVKTTQFQNRNYIIFDQLNPSYAKYYTKKEAYNLFKKAGFKDITVSSRHNYSWVLIGKK